MGSCRQVMAKVTELVCHPKRLNGITTKYWVGYFVSRV